MTTLNARQRAIVLADRKLWANSSPPPPRTLHVHAKKPSDKLVRSLLVNALVASKDTPFKSDHRETLENMTDDALGELCRSFGIGKKDDDEDELRVQSRVIYGDDEVLRAMVSTGTLSALTANLPDEERDALLARQSAAQRRRELCAHFETLRTNALDNVIAATDQDDEVVQSMALTPNYRQNIGARPGVVSDDPALRNMSYSMKDVMREQQDRLKLLRGRR